MRRTVGGLRNISKGRTRVYAAVILVLLLVIGVNVLFVRDFFSSSSSVEPPKSASVAESDVASKSPPTKGGKAARTSAPEEIIDRQAWLHSLTRGLTVDMYNLTQLNDCKRLPSWRANEKRFIRLQADRQKAPNCIHTAGLNHTQLFALRTVSDVTTTSHHHYMEYTHEKDTTPEETPMLLLVIEEYLKREGQYSVKEAHRLFSIASIATSDAFSWAGDESNHATAPNAHRMTHTIETVDDMIETGRFRKALSADSAARSGPSGLELNPDALNECAFSASKSLSHVDLDAFSREGYHLVQFLFEETFLKHGWITVPVAGTALGSLRHHGMFRGDDDMDMTTYPPSKYLLQGGDKEAWGRLYDDFDEIVETFGKSNAAFTWFKSNDYRFHHPWYTRNDKKKKLPDYPFVEYEDHVRHDGRVCFAQYMTFNATEKRRLFQTEGCTPNHWFMCLQPSSYIYSRHDEMLERHVIQDVNGIFEEDANLLQAHLKRIGPMVFTAFHRRPAGKFCKCKFGFKHSSSHEGSGDPSYGICFENLPDFVQYWYDGKWCVPSGAVRTRKWSFLKSWND
ncbi:membrane-associated protein, putative [Bodo saltans]|uniref:Membrane-associated protein, putative n=1 Tax=Bodo saltans TaxID=75058 RepID=A0A0S4JLF1_BODSA|nr:membrane-associated protein, putative [Bodo saltans]|eukprot:CUG92350.1 membrane-associated protein, putative [Bodo saltans]